MTIKTEVNCTELVPGYFERRALRQVTRNDLTRDVDTIKNCPSLADKAKKIVESAKNLLAYHTQEAGRTPHSLRDTITYLTAYSNPSWMSDSHRRKLSAEIESELEKQSESFSETIQDKIAPKNYLDHEVVGTKTRKEIKELDADKKLQEKINDLNSDINAKELALSYELNLREHNDQNYPKATNLVMKIWNKHFSKESKEIKKNNNQINLLIEKINRLKETKRILQDSFFDPSKAGKLVYPSKKTVHSYRNLRITKETFKYEGHVYHSGRIQAVTKAERNPLLLHSTAVEYCKSFPDEAKRTDSPKPLSAKPSRSSTPESLSNENRPQTRSSSVDESLTQRKISTLTDQPGSPIFKSLSNENPPQTRSPSLNGSLTPRLDQSRSPTPQPQSQKTPQPAQFPTTPSNTEEGSTETAETNTSASPTPKPLNNENRSDTPSSPADGSLTPRTISTPTDQSRSPTPAVQSHESLQPTQSPPALRIPQPNKEKDDLDREFLLLDRLLSDDPSLHNLYLHLSSIK